MRASWLENETPIDAARLASEGIPYERRDPAPAQFQPLMDELKRERGYVEQDEVELSPDTPNLETLCAKFVDEHTHDDDEVRFVHKKNWQEKLGFAAEGALEKAFLKIWQKGQERNNY